MSEVSNSSTIEQKKQLNSDSSASYETKPQEISVLVQTIGLTPTELRKGQVAAGVHNVQVGLNDRHKLQETLQKIKDEPQTKTYEQDAHETVSSHLVEATIRESMTIAPFIISQDAIKNENRNRLSPLLKFFHRKDKTLDDIYARTTADNCQLISAVTIANIIDTHPEMVEDAIIIRTFRNKRFPFKRDTNAFIHRWPFHAMFLIHGKDGSWYAGSPGNYDLDRDQDQPALTTLYKSDTLDSLLAEIEKEEGGKWPNSSYVVKTLQDEKFKKAAILKRGEDTLRINLTYLSTWFGIINSSKQQSGRHAFEFDIPYIPTKK